jgi:hypothetical protein
MEARGWMSGAAVAIQLLRPAPTLAAARDAQTMAECRPQVRQQGSRYYR